MKKKKGLMILLAAACMLTQAQPVYAVQTETAQVSASTAVTDPAVTPEQPGNTETPVTPEQPGNTETPVIPEQPGNTETPVRPEQPGSTETPVTPEQPGSTETTEQPETPAPEPAPDKVKGLRTTCKSDTSVLVEWSKSARAVSYTVYRKQGSGSYKKLGTTKKTSYEDKHISYGKSYTYQIIPYNKEKKKGKAATIGLKNQQAVNIRSQKYTYKQMVTDMKELKAQYSDYCMMESIGKSVKGRYIYDFSIGDSKAKKSLLVVSTLHAREYICSVLMMKEIQYYLRNYNKKIGGVVPAKVLKNIRIHYVVMANPDGVTISQTSSARWKANGRGVDLNKNFPAKKFVVGGKKGSQGYTGPKALSEPEAKAIANLTIKLKKSKKLCGVINYHAMGNIIYGDCSNKKLKKNTTKMYNIAKSLTGYKKAPVTGGKSTGGQYREYVMDILNLPSITLEVGKVAAPCSYNQYEKEFQKNKMVVLKIAQAL